MNECVKAVKSAKKVALFTHITPDGDAIGSTFAMGRILNSLGIENRIYINEKIPQRLLFLANYAENNYYTEYKDENYDLMIALDCGDLYRLGEFAHIFEEFENTVVIDHHVSNTGYGKINYVEAHGSSTGELIWHFANLLGAEIDSSIASMIYGAIVSDTGCFKYSSTTPKTLSIASGLMEKGADYVKICKKLFDTEDMKTLKLRALGTEKMELFYEGKVAVIPITAEDLENLGAVYEDAESLIDIPRSVEGVEVGATVKEWKDKTKVSIRTNEYVDASKFASLFGGGGHIRAAGFVSEKSVAETKEILVKKLEEFI